MREELHWFIVVSERAIKQTVAIDEDGRSIKLYHEVLVQVERERTQA